MKNERLSIETKKQIMEMKNQGMKPKDIAEKLDLSESGVYRVIQQQRATTISMEWHTRSMQEMEADIKSLREENKKLQEDNRRLLLLLEKAMNK